MNVWHRFVLWRVRAARVTLTDRIAGDLWADQIVVGPYSAAHAAGSAVDTLRRNRIATLVTLVVPKRVVDRWCNESIDSALAETEGGRDG